MVATERAVQAPQQALLNVQDVGSTAATAAAAARATAVEETVAFLDWHWRRRHLDRGVVLVQVDGIVRCVQVVANPAPASTVGVHGEHVEAKVRSWCRRVPAAASGLAPKAAQQRVPDYLQKCFHPGKQLLKPVQH